MNSIRRYTLGASILFAVIAALFGFAALWVGQAHAASLPAVTCSYDGLTNTRTCELWAVTGSIDLPGSAGMPIWGFTDQDPASVGTAQLPGPAIIANQGETIEVILHNQLGAGEDTSMIFHGQAMMPDLVGVADGGTTTYTFLASNPGTYLYEAGPLPGAQHQVAMGLHGALIVRPAIANQAYDDSDTTFQDEALLVLSDIDPALNTDPNPAAFDMRDYAPKFFLINGKAYPDTDEIASAAGNKVLLRFVNAGIEQHSMGALGVDQEVLATDGSPLSNASLSNFFRVAAATIGAGQTTDRMVTVPASAGSSGDSRYAIYDSSLLLHNNGAAGFGGMLTFITVTDGAPPTIGPSTTSVSLSPNPTDGSVPVTISAIIPGATSAEYFVGSQGTGGAGTSMDPGAGADEWTADISTAALSTLADGDHTIYVHGSNGTWGAFNFAGLHLDKLGPATTGITLAPNPSAGSVDVVLSATGNDSTTGNSNVIAAEYFIDTTGADGEGTPLVVNVIAPIASLDATIPAATIGTLSEGAHTVYVHSMDSFGLWGAYEMATLVVDQTGPTTSNVTARPNPNNGALPYNPTVSAVRVDATLTDTSSNIQQAEGFINTVGADGTGFPLTPSDGLFDETVEDAYVYIPMSTISTLGVGTHQIYVHGQDTSGNWGAAVSVDFVIETDLPTVTNVAVDPTSTDGTVPVALTATASDASSDILMAEWFAGPDPGTGNGTPMTISFNGIDWDLAATIDATGWAPGDYTISVRARDAAGNWSPTDSTILTVTAGPPTPLALLYFSTAGNAAIPGVPGPNDDADVYLWDATLFSRVLDGSAEGGLPGNTDIDGLAFEGGLFYLSFNRNGGTNVPGVGVVQDEDVVTYNPGDLQWELFSAGIDLCDGMDASNGHDIDAFDIVDGVVYFSTEGDAPIAGLAGPFDNADIYSVDPVLGCSRVFDASVEGLPGNANVDGLTAVDGDTFYMSFDQDGISVPDVGTVQDEDVVLYDVGVWSLYFDGTAPGLSGNGQNLDAIDVQ